MTTQERLFIRDDHFRARFAHIWRSPEMKSRRCQPSTAAGRAGCTRGRTSHRASRVGPNAHLARRRRSRGRGMLRFMATYPPVTLVVGEEEFLVDRAVRQAVA